MQTPAVKTLLVKNAGKEKFCTTYIMVNTPKPLPLHFTYQPSSTRRVNEARCPSNLTTSTRGTALQKLHYSIILSSVKIWITNSIEWFRYNLVEIIMIFKWSPLLTNSLGHRDTQRIDMQRCIGFSSEQPNIIHFNCRPPHHPLDLNDGKKSGWCRVAELGSLSSGAKMAMKIFVKRVFTIFATNASFLRVIANFQI